MTVSMRSEQNRVYSNENIKRGYQATKLQGCTCLADYHGNHMVDALVFHQHRNDEP